MQNKFRAVGAAQNSIPIIYAAKARSGVKGRRTRSVEECTDSRLGPQMFYIFARTCNSLAAGARDRDDDCAACPRIPAQHLERWNSKRVESHWRLEARQKNRSWRREQGGGEVDDLFLSFHRRRRCVRREMKDHVLARRRGRRRLLPCEARDGRGTISARAASH